jgi:hypothetical protein
MPEYVFLGGLVGLARSVALALFCVTVGFIVGFAVARLEARRR